MPNYKTHDAINLIAYGMGLTAYSMATNVGALEPLSTRPMLAFTATYLIGTFLVTPDLDLWVSKPGKRWGLLRILWMPYATVMKHRRLSHGYLLGPVTRLLYIALLLTPLALAPTLATSLHTFTGWYFTPPVLAGAILGYYTSQWMHLIADKAPFRL